MIILKKLVTEERNKNSLNLDKLTIHEKTLLMNNEDKLVAARIEKSLSSIETVINNTITCLKNNGRLIYIGAGTSGRLGILDAAECVPTFGIAPGLVIGMIAGGNSAVSDAIEGAEDDKNLGKRDLEKININKKDMVIGITASGRTPYVIGALDYANYVGANTASISCNINSEVSKISKNPIEVDCGPEVLTGSTRLKAGSAQKMILNMISTLSMAGLGKIYENLMVDLKPTNEKLRERSKKIIMDATKCSYSDANDFLEKSKDNVKIAIVMALTGLSYIESSNLLDRNKGYVRNVLE